MQIVEGLSAACRENGCALLGGETAEMPGFYADGEYDVAGFIVGAVDREQLIDGRMIRSGDTLIGVPSSGLHTNGYSLARRIAFDVAGLSVNDMVPELGARLARRFCGRIAATCRSLGPAWKGAREGHGSHHRRRNHRQSSANPAGRVRSGDRSKRLEVPALFKWLQRQGSVPDEDMLRTFNMGIGLIVICGRDDAGAVMDMLAGSGELGGLRIGEIQDGAGVRYR